eukprot:SAG22_NODE_800_length_7109_cov_47.259058_4_plen_287_part_00
MPGTGRRLLRLLPPLLAVRAQLAAAGPAGGAAPQCLGIENGINYDGNDLPGQGAGATAATASLCCSMCSQDAACQFFTFAPFACQGAEGGGCCHKKTSKAGAVSAPGRVSGASKNYEPPAPPPPAPAGAKNVLLMLADDLRPQLMSAYAHPWMKTPNIDDFTKTATVFLRAYVQQQVCSPSRNSFMTVGGKTTLALLSVLSSASLSRLSLLHFLSFLLLSPLPLCFSLSSSCSLSHRATGRCIVAIRSRPFSGPVAGQDGAATTPLSRALAGSLCLSTPLLLSLRL